MHHVMVGGGGGMNVMGRCMGAVLFVRMRCLTAWVYWVTALDMGVMAVVWEYWSTEWL